MEKREKRTFKRSLNLFRKTERDDIITMRKKTLKTKNYIEYNYEKRE